MINFIDKLSSKQKKSFKYLLLLLILGSSILLFYKGLRSMKNAYQISRQETYNVYYNSAYEFSESQNHVANRVAISVENARVINRLEVLTVSSSEFIIKNPDNNDKTISWLEVKGTGVFTIDLSVSEFITDSERGSVLVRVPKPELTECKVSDTEEQFLKNTAIFSNGSIGEGIKLAQIQLSEGRIKLEDSMKQNRTFYDAAKKSAILSIKSLVQEWNPDIPDLHVEVELMESE